ncbi:glycosyltransferase family 2 protein [Larkinella rosea]|uniref:Glycosyltransferase family 2 protein n=1 Tax=Larkinella rosea TaxID=2025312 RepID=A0A3P1C1F1_9BACT|nr:glycosyltransferase family 2 protein [Larkinella rosea]RRB07049.1 glycosyltransferase family 2 protein [Larkinella rosea]
MMLSIIIPAYNEEKTIGYVLKRVAEVSLPIHLNREIVVVDDGSVDQTGQIVQRFMSENPQVLVQYIRQSVNRGKGEALHTGIRNAGGQFIIIQDADLEYDPEEYGHLLQPLLSGRADVVYGSRFMGGRPHRVLYFWHTVGNRFLTLLSNMLTDLNLTDMETCFKVFRSEIIKGVELKEKRFGFEPEVTAKISRIPGIRIYEVGISYYGRTYQEGKKIGWRDGFRAIFCILKYNLFVMTPREKTVLNLQTPISKS